MIQEVLFGSGLFLTHVESLNKKNLNDLNRQIDASHKDW